MLWGSVRRIRVCLGFVVTVRVRSREFTLRWIDSLLLRSGTVWHVPSTYVTRPPIRCYVPACEISGLYEKKGEQVWTSRIRHINPPTFLCGFLSPPPMAFRYPGLISFLRTAAFLCCAFFCCYCQVCRISVYVQQCNYTNIVLHNCFLNRLRGERINIQLRCLL